MWVRGEKDVSNMQMIQLDDFKNNVDKYVNELGDEPLIIVGPRQNVVLTLAKDYTKLVADSHINIDDDDWI